MSEKRFVLYFCFVSVDSPDEDPLDMEFTYGRRAERVTNNGDDLTFTVMKEHRYPDEVNPFFIKVDENGPSYLFSEIPGFAAIDPRLLKAYEVAQQIYDKELSERQNA